MTQRVNYEVESHLRRNSNSFTSFSLYCSSRSNGRTASTMAQTDDTLSASLRRHLDDVAISEGFTKYTIEHQSGSNKGDGFMATMLAVTVVGERLPNADGTQRSGRLELICKVQPSNDARQEQFSSAMLFDREVLTYNRILPAIEQFQRERGGSGGVIAYPKCYLAIAQSPTNDALIIMEDLRASNHTMWDKKQTLQFANAKLVFEQLGLLHGVSVAMRDQQPDVFAEFNILPNIFEKMTKSGVILQLIMSSYDRLLGMLDNPQHIKIIEALKNDFMPINVKCMDHGELGAFSVLSHGDCWNNNMMYTAENNVAQSVCIVDWQLARVTTPAVDLSYFLFSSTDRALREKHLDELLRLYYAKFAGIVRQCGSDPEKLYTFDDLLAQMRKFGVYGVMSAPILLSIMVTDAENLVNMDEMSENAANNVNDGHMAILNDKSELIYKQRVTDVLDEAIQYGWLPDYVN